MGLLELLIYISIVCVALGAIGVATSSNAKAYSVAQGRTALQARASQALERVARELSSATAASLSALPLEPNYAGLLDVDLPAAVDPGTGAVTWITCRLALASEPGETNDGVDQDGDGLIDEGQLTWTRDVGGPAQRSVVLASNVPELAEGETFDGTDENGNGLVDEGGFSLSYDGQLLRVSLTLEQSDPATGPQAASLTTFLRCRN
jgi:hypothetical protein